MKRKISLFLLIFVALFTLVCANIKVSAADGEWKLVTDANTLEAGDQIVIVAKDDDYALSTVQNSNNRGRVAITKGTNKVTINNDVQIISLEAGTKTGSFAFNVGNGYLYAAGGTSTKNNHLRTSTSKTAAASWTVSISDSIATIKTVDETVVKNWMRYNSSSSIFSCYSSGQADVVIYELVGSVDNDAKVLELFDDFYNNGTYVKESVLNVNQESIKDVNAYFHAGAVAPYRMTTYSKNSLSMVTKNASNENYDQSTLSVYENISGGGVKHYGLGQEYTTNWTDYDQKFVTLKDFKESNIKGWVSSAGVYTFNLVETTSTTEDEMTRMAREFVAPMWLAPNSSNYNYVVFEKLTVQKVEDTLIMKLYVKSTNSGKLNSGSDLIFSQVEIKKAYNVSVASGENYSVETDKAIVASGNTLDVVLNIKDGFVLSGATVTNATYSILDNVITIKNISGDVVVTPTLSIYQKVTKSEVQISTYASQNSWVDSTRYTILGIDADTDVKAVYSSGSNTGKYYSGNGSWRFYQNETAKVSFESNRTIKSIVITFTAAKTGTLNYGSTVLISGTACTINSKSFQLTIGNSGSATNGNIQITKIVINYAD